MNLTIVKSMKKITFEILYVSIIVLLRDENVIIVCKIFAEKMSNGSQFHQNDDIIVEFVLIQRNFWNYSTSAIVIYRHTG